MEIPNTDIYHIRSQEPKFLQKLQQWLSKVSTFLYNRLIHDSLNSTMFQIVSRIPWKYSASAAPNATTHVNLTQPLMDPVPQNTYTTANTPGHLSAFLELSHLSIQHPCHILPAPYFSSASSPKIPLLPLLSYLIQKLIMVLPPEYFVKHWSLT